MRHVACLGVLVLSAAGCAGVDDTTSADVGQTVGSSTNLEIHQINVGWGSSVFVIGPDGTTVLLEAGDTGRGTSRVVPYLTSLGILSGQGLDYTIAGHQHCDHIGGLDEVIDAGYDVHVANFYNGSANTSSCVTSWNTAAATTTAGAPVVPSPGEVIALGGGATLTFVAVNGNIIGGGTVPVTNENDRSIAVLIQHGGFDYLWASDLGGGNIDTACTGRSTTSQIDVESFVIQAISPGGAAPRISAGGIDVLNVNHHGSESSTNINWMNEAAPAVALIGTGDGQGVDFQFPRIDVVEHVLQAEAACVTVSPALVLQSEEGSPTGSQTSFAGYTVGNIRVLTDGASEFTVSADGAVSVGVSEVGLAGLPLTFALDNAPPVPDTEPPATSVTSPAGGATVAATVTVTASASDNVGVARVQLWIDGALFSTDWAAPYEWSWNTKPLANGSHSIYTVAFDAGGNFAASSTVGVTVDNLPEAIVILNEILANEPGSATSGEFIELVNVGNAPADLSGWQLWDAVQVRHTFPAGTTLPAGLGLVVFASQASTGSLSLNNTGDTVRVTDAVGATVDSIIYGSSLAGTDGVSMNRNPDATAGAPWVLHTVLSSLPNSPGQRADGSPFGECTFASECDDGDACNGAEACVASYCVPGTPLACDDGNVCTDDSCNPTSGCATSNNTASCDDGNECTVGDVCSGGTCAPGEDTCPPVAVVILNEILANEPGSDTSGEFIELVNVGDAPADLSGWQLWDAVQVRHTFPAGTQLPPSTGLVVLASGASTGALSLNNTGDTVRVTDVVGATVDSLTYGSGLAGTDGVSMNRNPDATAGAPWVLHTVLSSLPSSPGRRVDGSPFGECDFASDCADADVCNGAEICVAGSCVPGTPLTCDDGNVCTDDSCNPTSGCATSNNTASCSDANVCNGAETCAAGACVPGTPLTCDDGNVCTDDSCNPTSGCATSNNTASCDDGNACTVGDLCSGGSCTPGEFTCAPDVIATDGFENNFSGGTGWAEASWRVAGDASIRNGEEPHSGKRHARLQQASGSMKRSINLSGRTGAHLEIWMKVNSFESADLAYVKASIDNGSSYTTLITLGPAQSNNLYQFYDLDLAVCDGAASCEIYFDAGMNATNDRWYLDDIEITAF
jgi:beta-lactamase superfamily II metal-dependent hydrolase